MLKYLPFLLLLFLGACSQPTTEECQCEKIKIYGFPSNITSPFALSKQDMLGYKPVIIEDEQTIKKLFKEIKNLNRSDSDTHVDNRFLLELVCKNGGKLFVESNNYHSKVGDSYFEPSNEFIELVLSLTKIQQDNANPFLNIESVFYGEWHIANVIINGSALTCNVCPRIEFIKPDTAKLTLPTGDEEFYKWSNTLETVEFEKIGDIENQFFQNANYKSEFENVDDYIEMMLIYDNNTKYTLRKE